ncbi:MAG: F0F1 ATP synthase subunit B [Actinobacteria bacterium]|nr:F0F1 ATP synthase subunit B [Actinomycetota bacterium]
MRLRALVASGLAAGVVLLSAPAAVAMEEEHEIPVGVEENSDLGEEELHCLAEQVAAFEALEANPEAGSRVETCEESPNPILPATNEIVWGGIAFLVVFFLMWKFAVPAIRKGLQAREDRIRSDLEAAEAAKQEAENLRGQYQQQIADARAEAGRIIDEARQAADAMRRDVHESAEAEATAARARAESEIDLTVSRAQSDLQREVADFAVRLAERIVERNLDRDAQQALIDQYIAEVGGLGGNGRSRGGNGSGGSASDN